MTTLFEEHQASLKPLKDKKIALLGYGSQARAHAANLKDAGCHVTVGLRQGSPSHQVAQAAGLKTDSVSNAVRGADLVAFLFPDMNQADVYEKEVKPNLKTGATLLFAHGLNIHFGYLTPPQDSDVVMVAPKSPGDMVRETYLAGQGVPCLVAVSQDVSGQALETALAYAHGLGCTRAGALLTTFKEETETDLFGEQAVLCGGVSALVQSGFEVLTEAGYQPEVAYFECLHELKLIVDLMIRGGLRGMRQVVSETAKYGDVTCGPRVIDRQVKDTMKDILHEIQSGAFADEWRREHQSGLPHYNQLLAAQEDHPLEQTGRLLRERMFWLRNEEPKKEMAT